MTTNQTIDGVPRKSLEQALKLAAVFDDGGDGADAESARGVVWILRALLDKTDADIPASTALGEPVMIEAVAVTRDNGDGSLRLEWLLEGGIAQMEFAGMVLFSIPEANDLCDEGGSAEVYLSPQPAEQPAPVAVVLPERREPTQDNPYLSDADHEWNSFRDELKRVNPSL